MLNKGGARSEQELGGQADGPAFDASDFPSLTAAGGAGGRRSGDGAGETLAALLGGQQKGGGGGTAPSFQEDDFPALPGSSGGGSGRAAGGEGAEGAAQLQQLQQQLGGLTGNDAGLDAVRLQQQRQLAAAAARAPGGGAAAKATAASGQQPDRFGLLGLLSVIRMTGAPPPLCSRRYPLAALLWRRRRACRRYLAWRVMCVCGCSAALLHPFL
jgi:hypothetical protein